MNAIDVPVAFVALSENRSRIWLSLLLFFRTTNASAKHWFALCSNHGQQHLESGRRPHRVRNVCRKRDRFPCSHTVNVPGNLHLCLAVHHKDERLEGSGMLA